MKNENSWEVLKAFLIGKFVAVNPHSKEDKKDIKSLTSLSVLRNQQKKSKLNQELEEEKI